MAFGPSSQAAGGGNGCRLREAFSRRGLELIDRRDDGRTLRFTVRSRVHRELSAALDEVAAGPVRGTGDRLEFRSGDREVILKLLV